MFRSSISLKRNANKMIFCRICGAEIRSDTRKCPECGTPVYTEAGSRQNPAEGPETEADGCDNSVIPKRENGVLHMDAPSCVRIQHEVTGNVTVCPERNAPQPQANHAFAVLSTWDFLWSFVLLSIPVVGLIIAIVWACGGAHNQNRRHMGRACLLLFGAAALLALGIAMGAALQYVSWAGWYY